MVETEIKIVSVVLKDIRFPTSQNSYGSDAMHNDPDYSCVYVIINTNTYHQGFGLTFTLGRGNDIVKDTIQELSHIIMNENVKDIFRNFSSYWRKITNDSQLRWLGPEKGILHLATAGLVNALWDLWARIENKPIWKLLTDMKPEELISTIDFRYITDVITESEATRILYENKETRLQREKIIKDKGYPAYITFGWIGFSDEQLKLLCIKYLKLGFTGFKIKVGQNIDSDKRRCKIIRDIIGFENHLMIDANQKWDIEEAIKWVSNLAEYKPLWIEEPTSPDDILGHAAISKALMNLNIDVASGEMCSNRVMFKQFLQYGAIQFCQIDSCRLGSINEILAVYLMAKKFNIPVCPHAGGIGLCEMVQHLQIFDYICVSGKIRTGQYIEYVDAEHEHFMTRLQIQNGRYKIPEESGYSVRFKDEIFSTYTYPEGKVWKSKLKKNAK